MSRHLAIVSDQSALHREDMAAQELLHATPCDWCDYIGRHRKGHHSKHPNCVGCAIDPWFGGGDR